MKEKNSIKNFSFILLALVMVFSSLVGVKDVQAYNYTGNEKTFDIGTLKLRSSNLTSRGISPEYKLTNLDTGKSEILKITSDNGVIKKLNRGNYKVTPYNYDKSIVDLTNGGVKFSIPHKDEKGKLYEVIQLDMKASIDKYADYVPNFTDDRTIYVGETVDKDKLITNLPENATITIKKDIDSSTPGIKDLVITINFDDGKSKDYNVDINVINKPSPKPEKVYMKDSPDELDYRLIRFKTNTGGMFGIYNFLFNYGDVITTKVEKGEKIGKVPILYGKKDVDFIGWKQLNGEGSGKIYQSDEVKEMIPDTDIIFEAVFRPVIKENIKFIAGYPDGTFKPQNKITRSEMVAILARITNYNKNSVDKDYNLKYTDVKGDEWYADYLRYFDKYNIIAGYSDKTFRPEDTITNKEFYSIVRRLTEDVLKYDDIKWTDDYIAYMKSKGYINNSKTNTDLNEKASREDVVYILDSIVNENAQKNVKITKTFKDINKTYAKEAVLRCSE